MLRQHFHDFLEQVAPVAEEIGMRLCCHPDDPPFGLLGLPRLMSTEADYAERMAAVDLPANGITLCSGFKSYRAAPLAWISSLGVAQCLPAFSRRQRRHGVVQAHTAAPWPTSAPPSGLLHLQLWRGARPESFDQVPGVRPGRRPAGSRLRLAGPRDRKLIAMRWPLSPRPASGSSRRAAPRPWPRIDRDRRG